MRAGRADAIAETTDGVWGAAGVPATDVGRTRAVRQTYGTTAACAGLDPGDRWADVSTSRIGPGRAAQTTVLDGATAHLAGRGFAVARYRSSGSETRQLVASSVEEEQSIELFVEADGTASLRILAGPCAPLLAASPGPPYRPDA